MLRVIRVQKQDHTSIEKPFFSLLQKYIHKKHWELWFSSLTVGHVDTTQKVVTLELGNLFVLDWVKSRFLSILQKGVQEYFGRDFQLVLETPAATTQTPVDAPESQKPTQPEPVVPLVRKKPLVLSTLNPQYTFAHFVSGGGNALAFETIKEAARDPGKVNPVFIYGGVGLGKTHLLQAMGHHVHAHFPEKNVLYVTAEEFLNDLVAGIKQNHMEKFRAKYRDKIDVLLIDDIQFLAGKKGIQNELFHTFNTLFEAGKQIAFCSDRNPSELGAFHQRLVSRFQMGMVVEISPPDSQTRERIAQAFCRREKIALPSKIVEILAHSIPDNIRRIFGVLIKLAMMEKISGKAVDVPAVQNLLLEIGYGARERQTGHDPCQKLLFAAKNLWGVSPALLVSSSRKREVSTYRMVCMYSAHVLWGVTITTLARWFGKSHSSVHYAIKKVEAARKKAQSSFPLLVRQLERELQAEEEKTASHHP